MGSVWSRQYACTPKRGGSKGWWGLISKHLTWFGGLALWFGFVAASFWVCDKLSVARAHLELTGSLVSDAARVSGAGIKSVCHHVVPDCVWGIGFAM